jgi:DNA-binding NarL/FixJ family response regulator
MIEPRRLDFTLGQVETNLRELRSATTTLRHRLRATAGATTVAALPATRSTPLLTQRELAILRLIAEGHDNARIARMLHFGHGTIKLHVRAILQKLETTSRTAAAVRGVRLGLI